MPPQFADLIFKKDWVKPQVDGPVEIGFCLKIMTQEGISYGTTRVCPSELVIKADSFIEAFDRPVILALVEELIALMVVGGSIPRIQEDSSAMIFKSFLKVAQMLVGSSPQRVGFSILGIEADGQVELQDRC